MSTQLTGASAKVLFESPAQLNLKKKLLKEGNFEIVSSGPESATNLDKGITIVRTKTQTGIDPITDEPIYEYKQFEIKHPRENIADVLRRRLPRDAAGQLTIPGLAEPSMEDLNVLVEEFGIYLEPEEFTIRKQGEAAFTLTAKNNCVIFYGKIAFTNTNAVKEPLEVYEAEGGETEENPGAPSEGGEGSEGSAGEVTDPGDSDPETLVKPTIANLTYLATENKIVADVTNALEVTIKTTTGLNVTSDVVAGKVEYIFSESLPVGTIISVMAGDTEESVSVDSTTD